MAKQKARLTIKSNPIYKKYASGYSGRYLFYFGGGGSGKSIDAIQRIVTRVISQGDAKHKFLFIRKVANTIKDSIWDTTEEAFRQFGLLSKCKLNKQEKSIVYLPNGNQIIMKGLDDSEKIKSISGITGILIEEITELTEADFIQLNLRLRGQTKYPKQIFAMFNPVDGDHWLWQYVEPQLKGRKKTPKNVKNIEYLCDNVWQFDTITPDGGALNTRVINTNYKHNRFIDQDYINTLKMLSSVSENHSIVYEDGRWGQTEKGNSFVHQFRESKHTGEVELIEEAVLHYTQDFNVSPYMSGLVIQMRYEDDGFWQGFSQYWEVNVLDELSLEHPLNTAQDCGEELGKRFDLYKGLYLYGDASGNNRTGLKDTKTLFEDLLKGLPFRPNMRIPSQNPRYKRIAKGSLGRLSFINLLFSGKIPVKIKISPKCANFISDLKYCVQNANGQMDKKVRDGHHLDAFQYFVCHPESLGYLAEIRNNKR